MAAMAAAAAVSTRLSLTNSCTTSLGCSLYSPVVSLKLRVATLPDRLSQKRLFLFPACFAAQGIEVEEKVEAETGPEIRSVDENRTKLYVMNLPWSFSSLEVQKLFDQCGAVEEVEIIRMPNGRSKGYAFVTMESPEEAKAAIGKMDFLDLNGRIIRVQMAKRFKKPDYTREHKMITHNDERNHRIYVGNLDWKAGANNLRDFFSTKFKPVYAKVVFENHSGMSSGYGFVGFATKEEAEAAISELDGVELMGRPVRLQLSKKMTVASGSNGGHKMVEEP
ncbi:hypothetical protein HPP92_020564 [Vanilla planifolia]|uniref:RRM domain-containing protein n=1 Tax=Vanilla planifolia TaxID=51239 RepID=A0A835PZY3_VANPL|nr:hypothetical protein HPP92_020965 [Vanilla planifolia]KAG0462088.1 hypothetical protein HPP92_020564 [Vanilla planifolia]